MNKTELKSILLQLEEQANKHGADVAERMLSLVQYAFSGDRLPVIRLREISGVSKSAFYRKTPFSFTPSEDSRCSQNGTSGNSQPSQIGNIGTSEESQNGNIAQEGFPPHPLSKNISSLRSDINTSPAGTHTREADAEADALREKVRKGFSDFMRIYPRQIRGTVSAKAQTAYKELVESGRSPEDIEDLVWAHAHTEEWTKENGRFVPNADKFLNRILHPEEEQPEKSASGAPEGSGYIQVPLDDRGAFSNVAESSVEARFLKAYGRWYKNLYAFNVAWANAKRDVDPELLVFCAEVARDKARERDGDTQYIRLPEEWLRDGRYMDYVKEAEYKKRTSGPSTIDIDAMLGLK